jgi:hypothetical protein
VAPPTPLLLPVGSYRREINPSAPAADPTTLFGVALGAPDELKAPFHDGQCFWGVWTDDHSRAWALLLYDPIARPVTDWKALIDHGSVGTYDQRWPIMSRSSQLFNQIELLNHNANGLLTDRHMRVIEWRRNADGTPLPTLRSPKGVYLPRPPSAADYGVVEMPSSVEFYYEGPDVQGPKLLSYAYADFNRDNLVHRMQVRIPWKTMILTAEVNPWLRCGYIIGVEEPPWGADRDAILEMENVAAIAEILVGAVTVNIALLVGGIVGEVNAWVSKFAEEDQRRAAEAGLIESQPGIDMRAIWFSAHPGYSDPTKAGVATAVQAGDPALDKPPPPSVTTLVAWEWQLALAAALVLLLLAL